ncbi:serpin family protein, partial [Candidatus Poribacteria bacterium]
LLLCPIICMFSLFGCSEDTEEPVNYEEMSAQLTAGSQRRGFGVLKELYGQKRDENLFISPLSISIALAMTYNGAAGETQKAMAHALEWEDMSLGEVNETYEKLIEDLELSDPDVRLSLANSLWARVDRTFHEECIGRIREYYDAEFDTLDFIGDPQGSIDVINAWVSEKTEDKIPDLLKELPPFTALILVNTIYFKGGWTVKFDPADTHDGSFHLLDGSTKQVPMMHQRQAPFPIFKGDNFSSTRIPYGDGRICMYIFLPDSDFSIQEFVEQLGTTEWRRWTRQLNLMAEGARMGGIELSMPRFKIEYDAELKDALTNLGMGEAFSPEADFSELGPLPLWISQVKHGAFVEVNEEGTEATAATAVIMVDSSDWDPTRFIVDRPFFFAIQDDVTGAVLFAGVVVEPM